MEYNPLDGFLFYYWSILLYVLFSFLLHSNMSQLYGSIYPALVTLPSTRSISQTYLAITFFEVF